MRAFSCPLCNGFVSFESHRCPSCQAHVGLHLPSKSMILTDGDSAMIDGQRWVRCTQWSTLGCNWLAPEDQEAYARDAAWPVH